LCWAWPLMVADFLLKSSATTEPVLLVADLL
jgi:hypothetical protein